MEDDYVRSLKDNIRLRGLEKYFIFEEFVKPNQALSLSDLTVLPSENEGFGICSIESFQMKKLHIRTKTTGYSDMEDCCIGIEIGDEEALAKEIERYLDGADYSKLTQHAYDVVQRKFTAEVMTDQIIRIYENAIKG